MPSSMGYRARPTESSHQPSFIDQTSQTVAYNGAKCSLATWLVFMDSSRGMIAQCAVMFCAIAMAYRDCGRDLTAAAVIALVVCLAGLCLAFHAPPKELLSRNWAKEDSVIAQVAGLKHIEAIHSPSILAQHTYQTPSYRVACMILDRTGEELGSLASMAE